MSFVHNLLSKLKDLLSKSTMVDSQLVTYFILSSVKTRRVTLRKSFTVIEVSQYWVFQDLNFINDLNLRPSVMESFIFLFDILWFIFVDRFTPGDP